MAKTRQKEVCIGGFPAKNKTGGATVRLCQKSRNAQISMKWRMQNDANRRKQWKTFPFIA